MMCEVPATVNVYRAECSLSDSDSHFFQNNSSFRLLNVYIINRREIARNDRISNFGRNGAY